MSVKNTNKVTIHIFYMIVTVQGEREHDEEEDMCQEKEKDRYSEKEMYPDEAHIATAPLAALDQFDLGEKDTGPKQPKLHHYHFGTLACKKDHSSQTGFRLLLGSSTQRRKILPTALLVVCLVKT